MSQAVGAEEQQPISRRASVISQRATHIAEGKCFTTEARRALAVGRPGKGPIHPQQVANAISGLLLIYPLFLWALASPTLLTLAAIQALVGLVFYCGYYATVPPFLAELFPTRRRTTGISIAYVLAQLVFGGVTPLVVNALIGAIGNPAAPGLYLAAVTLLSLVCLAACWRLKAEDAKIAVLQPAG
jgi:hypothetical protein